MYTSDNSTFYYLFYLLGCYISISEIWWWWIYYVKRSIVSPSWWPCCESCHWIYEETYTFNNVNGRKNFFHRRKAVCHLKVAFYIRIMHIFWCRWLLSYPVIVKREKLKNMKKSFIFTQNMFYEILKIAAL